MQRKNILIPIVAVLSLAGAVWANSIFPSTDEFPSSPKTQGTLGYIFDQYFTSTGIAKDGAVLAGRSATGYLQGTNCAQFEVWKGIDTSGKAICK